MTKCFKEVRRNELITDNHFRFHRGETPNPLIASVRREGVLMPLIAINDGNDRLIVLDGYRRLSLAGETDMLPVRVLDDRKTALRETVEINMMVSPYSEMEKAVIVSFADWNGWMSEKEILDTLLPRLGLKGQRILLDTCLSIRQILPELLNILTARKAPLKFTVRLSRETPDEQSVLVEMFSRHRFSLSQMVQVYDLLVPIRKREEMGFSQIIAGMPEGDADFLAALRGLRFPRTREIREKLSVLLKPYRRQLAFPEDLEGDAFRFSCQIRTAGDARKFSDLLMAVSEDEDLFRFLAEHTGND